MCVDQRRNRSPEPGIARINEGHGNTAVSQRWQSAAFPKKQACAQAKRYNAECDASTIHMK